MINSDNSNPQDEGKNVWLSLSDQLIELQAFVRSMLASVLKYFLKHKWLFLVLPLLGAVLGYGRYAMQGESYEASMTVSYVHLEKKIYADMLEKVNRAIQNDDLSSTEGFDRLSPEAMKSLISLGSTNIKGEPLQNDLSADKVPFNIHFRVVNTDYLSELGEATLTYLNSPDFIQERIEYNNSKAKDQMAFYQALIATQQSELKALNDDRGDAYAVLLSAINESRLLITEAQAQLTFNKNIEPLHRLSKSSAMPAGNGKRSVLIGFFIGFALAAGVALFRI